MDKWIIGSWKIAPPILANGYKDCKICYCKDSTERGPKYCAWLLKIE